MGLKFGAPQYPQFAAASGICTILILLPITSHWKAKNVATLSMIFWLFILNLTRFVNTLVWANNVEEKIPVWCDITTKLDVGASIALPSAALCICRYLEAVASVRWARQTETQKRNRRYFEFFMCFGLPAIFMGLHYISQGHRFDIIEHLGCTPSVVVTWVAYLTLYAPPMALATVAFVYAGLAIRHFYRRRVDFQKHLSATNAGISSGRYLRLMMLALTEMILDLGVQSFIIWVNVKNAGIVPYNWVDVHFHFSRVQQIPFLFMTPFFWTVQQAVWWIIPVSTIAFWSFFAFGQESMAEYRSWWRWFQRVILRRDVSASLPGSSTRVQRLGFNVNKSANTSTGTAASRGTSATNSSTNSRPKIHIPFPSTRKGTAGQNRLENDDDSFVSGDEEKKHPLSPISPTGVMSTPTATDMELGMAEYPQLDFSVFDTISRNSLSDALNADSPNSQTSLHDPYHPYHHGQQNNQSTTFGATAVRAGSPDVHTNEVKVSTETQVSVDIV